MTATAKSRPALEILRRRLGPALLLVAAPKCVPCLLAYAGVGAALGLGGPEICGATPPAGGPWLWWLTACGVMSGVAALRRHRA